MDALVLHGIGDLRFESVARPIPGDGEALVKVAAVGICGSDIPRVYEHGTYHYPLIPGHEVSGIVAEARGSGSACAGDRVTIKPLIPCRRCEYCEIGQFGQCVTYDYVGSRRDGGLAEYVTVPQASLLALPDGVGLAEAALTEPAAVALHALRRGGVAPGDTIAVLGAGPIGMMVAQWARVMGAGHVLLVDIDAQKLALADRLSLGEACDATREDPVEWVRERTRGRGPDLVVEAAGASLTFEQALRMVRPLGRVVILGNPSSDVLLPQSTVSQILRKQLTIAGTWNSEFTHLPVDEWQVVLDMQAEGRIDISAMISHRVPLRDGVPAMEMLRDRREFAMRVVLVNDAHGMP